MSAADLEPGMSRPSTSVLAVACAVLLLAVGPAAAVGTPTDRTRIGASAEQSRLDVAGGVGSAVASDGDVHLTAALALTPRRPGSIDVTLRYAIPDRVLDLATVVPRGATVTATSGFRSTGDRRYEWRGGTATPTLTYRLPANETGSAGGPEADTGRYLFADAGPWALVNLPPTTTEYRYRGDRIGIDRTFTTAGEGIVGDAMAFLGPVEVHRASAAGQRFTLVVPRAARLAESPERILSAVRGAARNLSVGPRDETVVVFAAPAGADWAVRGLQVGESDVWVQADQELDEVDSVWVHEYVHTRQAYNATAGTRWFVEGSATYYTALLGLRSGRIGFGAFGTYLAQGTLGGRGASVLSEPETWTANANYRKGALVAGVLDRRIRLATGGERTLGTVADRWLARDDALTVDGFVSLVGRVAGDDGVRAAARRYTRTDAAPSMWNQSQHEAAFGPLPPRVTYDLPTESADAGALWVEGPFRNGTLDPEAERPATDSAAEGRVTLVTGETLVVGAVVANDGGGTADYDAALRLDGEVLARWSGRLGSDASETLLANYTFAEPGTHELTFGRERLVVVVEEPAPAAVVDVGVEPRTVRAGEEVRIATTVANDADRPGRATVAFTVAGETVAERTVSLAAGERRAVESTVTLREPGTVAVGVASGGTVPVTVEGDAGSAADGATADDATPGATATDAAGGLVTDAAAESTTDATGGGFAPASALAALAVLTLVALAATGRRRRFRK